MNQGFTVRPPAPPRVFAKGNEPRCGKKFMATECHRAVGHPGAHLSRTGQYQQAEESVTS